MSPTRLILSCQALAQLISALLQRCLSPLKLCFHSAWLISAHVSCTSALPESLLMQLGLDRVITSMLALLESLVMHLGLVRLSSCMQPSGEDNGDSGRVDHEQTSTVWAEGRPCRHQGGSEAVAPHNQARHYWYALLLTGTYQRHVHDANA